MRETIYKYRTPLRIALLADLHDRPFERVTRSLKKRKPDMICIAGDVIHRLPTPAESLVIYRTEFVLPFLKACADIAPTFFSLGNHEWKLSSEDIAVISETGAVVLDNGFVRHGGVVIGGLSSAGFTAYKEYRRGKPDRYPEWSHGDSPDMTEPDISWLGSFCGQEGFKLLLCHHPEYRDRYLKAMPLDLVLCGHAHGGQIRLFGQGLFAPGQGFLPKYTGGVHGNMIISRGLANTGGMVPRLFNPTETVYILPK